MAKKRFRIKDAQGNVVPYDVAAEDVTLSDGRSVETGKATLLAQAGFLAPSHFPKLMLYNVTPFTSEPDYSAIPVGIVYLDESLEAPYKRLYYKKNIESSTQRIDLGAPQDGVVYCHQSTGKLYRWVPTDNGRDGSFQQVGGSGVNPDDKMSDSSENAVQNKIVKAYIDAVSLRLDTLIGSNNVQGVIDTFNEVKAFLAGISSSDTLAAKLATLVPQTRTINNKPLSGNVVIGINDIDGLAAAIAAAGSGAVSVSIPDPADGTFTIHVGDNSYTINLNHTHEGMVKLEKVTEATLPQTLADDTIYVQVDNLTTPTEIEALHIFGLEFTGGGLPAGAPQITSPKSTIPFNLGTAYGQGGATGTVQVKGKKLTANSSLTVSVGSGFSLSYGQQSGSSVTISAADATIGADVDIFATAYGTSGTLLIESQTDNISHAVDLTSDIELAGVKLTGTQWLQTDYCPGPNTEFSLKCKFTANSNTSNSNYGYQYCYILSCPYDGNKRFSLQNDMNMVNKACLVSYAEDNTTPGSIEVSNANFVADNSILRLTKGQSNLALTFLAGGNTQEQGGTTTLPLKTTTMAQPLAIGYLFSQQAIYGRYDLTVYEFILSEGGIEKRHYVPKIRNGVPGLYDTVNGTFISSETNDELVAIPLT